MPKLRKPPGFDPYGGVDKEYQPAADNFEYWSMCGTGPQGFGMYVMRQTKNGTEPATYVPYPAPLMSGRGGFSLAGNGVLYITGSNADNDEMGRAEKVAGFIPFVVGTVPPVNTTVDQTARDLANAASSVALSVSGGIQQAKNVAGESLRVAEDAKKTAIKAQASASESLNRPIPAAVSDDHIAQIAWGKAIDYTGTPEFVARVKSIAQGVLVDAIEFAKAATVAQSRLRALIEQIVKGF